MNHLSKQQNNYDDIINLPHHVSPSRPRMSLYDRAAQFSPFAALTGHGAAIQETARLTGQRIELDENSKQHLNERLQMIKNHLKDQPEVEFTYFIADQKKEGGEYVTVVGNVKKIKEYEQLIFLADGSYISIEDILSVDGELFRKLEE
ncbi:MAG: YolD-like family protein [Lachnospiraceae bacterium]|nr:YolD-like family protein [Lachnospiraceae bacterium]